MFPSSLLRLKDAKGLHQIERIGELEGKKLGCWCTENCHGQVLIKLYREYAEGVKTSNSKRDFIESENSSHPSKKIKFDHFSRKLWN